jgi:hypothetical protein
LVAVSLLGLAVGCGNGSGKRTSGCPVSRAVRIAHAVRADARAYWPWAGPSSELALNANPVYLLILSSSGAISRDGDEISRTGVSLHRALIAIAPGYRSAVEISGPHLGFARVDARYIEHIEVRGNEVSAPRVKPFLEGSVRERLGIRASAGARWRLVEVAIRLGRGCQRLSATGPRLDRQIVFRVPY